MDHLDLGRWCALLDAERDAADSMPQFVALQDSQTRLQLACNTLARFKANGPQGSVGSSPPRAAHDGERILAGGMGRHGPADITKAFDDSVRQLEARVAAAAHDNQRIELRRRQCGERLANLRRLIEQCRAWAAEQSPPVVLPGDEPGRLPPAVVVHGAPAGTPDFLGRQG